MSITLTISKHHNVYTTPNISISIEPFEIPNVLYKILLNDIYEDNIHVITTLINNAAYIRYNCAIYDHGKLVVKAGNPSFSNVVKLDLQYVYNVYDTYVVTDATTAYIVGQGFHVIY